MKIAIIRRWNVSAIDGVNRFIFTLADGLKRLGHQVVVLGHHMNEDPGNSGVCGIGLYMGQET